MHIDYTLSLPPFQSELVQRISALCQAVFTEPVTDLAWRLTEMPNASAVCAYIGDELIGFKLGYAMTQTKYYSWLGGVHASARRAGVASKLLELQHHWLRESGYITVETSANQENASMAQLNLKNGFHVCGTRIEPHRVQVLFAKELR